MATQTFQTGAYGGTVRQNSFGEYEATFLYNMEDPTHFGSTGDVSAIKVYKSENMAIRKVNAWIESN